MEPNQPQVERLVVLNNTPLTNFALVQRPDLIFSLWSSAACTTPAVLAEYERGVSSGKLPDGNRLLTQMMAAGFHSPLEQLDIFFKP